MALVAIWVIFFVRGLFKRLFPLVFTVTSAPVFYFIYCPGGSILASLGSFQQMWVSKQEYEEGGRAQVGLENLHHTTHVS